MEAGLNLQGDLQSSDLADASTVNSAKWVATELHDGLLQWVVSARMHIEATMAKLENHPKRMPTSPL